MFNLFQNLTDGINKAHAEGESELFIVPEGYEEEFTLNLDTMTGDDVEGHIAWYLETRFKFRETLGSVGLRYHDDCVSLCNCRACDLQGVWTSLANVVFKKFGETLYLTYLHDPQLGENYKIHLRTHGLFWETGYSHDSFYDDLFVPISMYLESLKQL